MIDIPPQFAGQPPINPAARTDPARWAQTWRGAQGLAADVRYYGQWMRDEAAKRIGHLYPTIDITADMVRERPDLTPYLGRTLTVIAWLWARTVKSPNPAFAHVDVPLVSTFILSTKPGNEAYVEPVIDGDRYRLTVKVGKPANPARAKRGTKVARGSHFVCILSGTPIPSDYIKAEGKAGRMGEQLIAIVAEGDRERVYLPPLPDHEAMARSAQPAWKPDIPLAPDLRALWTPRYGLTTFGDLFTPRQLVALTTFAELVGEAMERVTADYLAGADTVGVPREQAASYARAIGVYLAFAVDKGCDYWSTISTWNSARATINHAFTQQTIPMTWDYAEANPFSGSSGQWLAMVSRIGDVVDTLPACPAGHALHADARQWEATTAAIISTDPPYSDNIGYADLSDFFYVWLRRTLRPIFPELFATVTVPKAAELVATPYRHDSKAAADQFFREGMAQVLRRLVAHAHPAFPITIYYAFKQHEIHDSPVSANGVAHVATGWETFLDAVIRAGLSITSTWPIRTERAARSRGIDANALLSSIVLVCRPRPANAPVGSRREFVAALKAELPRAIRLLQGRGPYISDAELRAISTIAPVDLAQAAIGLGMAIYTRYATVLDAAGTPVSVREALALINQVVDETMADQEEHFDPETRWALAWFEQYGFGDGDFGAADVLAKAKNTSIADMVASGMLDAKRGKVRLRPPDALPAAWDPAQEPHLSHWMIVHHLIRVLDRHGEQATAALAAKLGSKADLTRELAYRLSSISERKQCPAEALAYHRLVQCWTNMPHFVPSLAPTTPAQARLEFTLEESTHGRDG